MRTLHQHVVASIIRPGLLLALLLPLTIFAAPRAAQAGGTVGNGTAASCTEAALRSAVSSGGKVTFNCGPNPVTITLSSEIRVDKNTEIDGGGKVTISGGGQTRIFYTTPIVFTLRNITLRDGFSHKGGAVRVANGTLYVYNSKFYNNSGLKAREEEGGGALSIHLGALFVENSYFEGNKGINGGAIYLVLSPSTIVNSTFVKNDSTAGGVRTSTFSGTFGFGGAVYTDGASLKDNTPGQMTIRNSTFIGNKARNNAGAVYTYLYTPDTALIEGSHFENNEVLLGPGGRAQGGALVHHQGPMTLRNSTFVNNRAEDWGGAMLVAQNGTGSSWDHSTIVNVTVTGNRADNPSTVKGHGGALFAVGGQVEVINSTLAGNYADKFGGGIYSVEDVVRLRNTIIAGNRVSDAAHSSQQCYKTYSGSSRNVQSAGAKEQSCSADAIKGDVKLAPLASNGGRTRTMALQAGSVAIDRGQSCPATDQRGAARVGACDAGAFEYGASAPSPAGLTAPAIQEVSASGGPAVRAVWAAVSGATYYQVEAAPANQVTELPPTLAAQETALTLVLDVGSYNLRVRACNEEGCGPYSGARSVSVSNGPEKLFLSLIQR